MPLMIYANRSRLFIQLQSDSYWLIVITYPVILDLTVSDDIRLEKNHLAHLGPVVMAGLSPVPCDLSPNSTATPLAMEIAEEKRSKRNPKQLDFEAVSFHNATQYMAIIRRFYNVLHCLCTFC